MSGVTRSLLFAALLLLFAVPASARMVAHSQPPVLTQDQNAEWRRSAKQRTSTTLSIALAGEAASMGFLLWLSFSGVAVRLRERFEAVLRRRFLVRCGYIIAISVLMFLATLPFELARFAVLRSYGIAQQALGPWMGDRLLELVVNLGSALFLGLLLYMVISHRPKTWWRWVAGAALPVTAAAILIGPFYVQLFNTLTPITNRDLADKILALAHRYEIPASDVFEIDMSRQTRAPNAFVSGIGPTTTIAIGDTLLSEFRDDETLFVTAHEMGHYVHKHLWIGLVLGSLLCVVAARILQLGLTWAVAAFGPRLGYKDLSDIASLPLLLLGVSILSFVSLPLWNSISRAMESDADRFAMQLTVPGDVSREAAASTFLRLGQMALSDPDPNPILRFIFWSHPTLDERVHMALYE